MGEPPSGSAPRKSIDGSGVRWLLGVPFAFLTLCLVMPFVAMLALALTEKGVGGSLAVVANAQFLAALWRTLILATIVTVLCLGAGAVYAVGLALSPRPVRIVLFAVLFVSFSVSVLVRTYGWVLLFQPNGALDGFGRFLGLIHDSFELLQTEAAMYPAMVHAMLPYMVLPLYAALRGIPESHFRAADSLGCSTWLALRSVVLPQLRSGAISGSILVFILSLGFFITPQLLGGPSDLLLATIIYREFDMMLDVGTASAMSIFLLVLVLALFVVADRVLKVTRAWEAR